MKEYFKKYFKYILIVLFFVGVGCFLFFYLTSFNYLAQNKAVDCSNFSHIQVSNTEGSKGIVYNPWCSVSRLGKLSLYNVLQPDKTKMEKASFLIRSVNLGDYFKGPTYLVVDEETINNKVINQLLWQEGFSSQGSTIKLELPKNNTAICGDINIDDLTTPIKVFSGTQEIPLRLAKDKYYFCTSVLPLEQPPLLSVAFKNTPAFNSFKIKLYFPPVSEQGNLVSVADFINNHDYFVPFDLGQLSFPL